MKNKNPEKSDQNLVIRLTKSTKLMMVRKAVRFGFARGRQLNITQLIIEAVKSYNPDK